MATKKQIIKLAVKDFYGVHCSRAKLVKQYMSRIARRPKLTEEEIKDVWSIRTNISDPVYRENIIKTPC